MLKGLPLINILKIFSIFCSPDISGDFLGFRVKLFINDQNSFGFSLEVCNLFLISKPYEHFFSLHSFLKSLLVYLYSSKDSLLFVRLYCVYFLNLEVLIDHIYYPTIRVEFLILDFSLDTRFSLIENFLLCATYLLFD